MRTRIVRTILLIVAILALPSVAHADMLGGWIETPLDNLEILHLFVLNLAIGIGESLVVWALLRTRPAFSVITVANYISAFLGFVLAGSMLAFVSRLFAGESLLQREVPCLVTLIGIAFVLTVLIEWPFFVLSMRGKGQTAQRIFWGCVAAQVASYICLTVAYCHVSDLGALFELKPVALRQISASPVATAYYIGERDGDLWRVATDGSGRTRVVKAGMSVNDGLSVMRDGRGRCRIALSGDVFTTDVVGICASDTGARDGVADLSGAGVVKTTYHIVFGGIDNSEFGETIQVGGKPVALETPLDRIQIDDATILPGNRAVVAMSNDGGVHEIDLLDLDDGRIAKLADGRSPVVVLEPTPTTKYPAAH